MALEPSLWGTLPKELLHLIFARLPTSGIGELRVLSKEWKRNVDCKDSEFYQVVSNATAHLKVFALLPRANFGGILNSSNIYGVQANKLWSSCKAHAFLSLDGADGGLISYVSQWSWLGNNPHFCIVMNPLMKQQRTQLPPLLCMEVKKSNTLTTMLRMVKLVVDRKTKKYQVFVVGCIIANHRRGFFAQVYDSNIKEWTVVKATQGHIIGWDYLGINRNFVTFPILCVYNCEDRTLQHFYRTSVARGFLVEPSCCVLLEDHLFVLHKETSLGFADLLNGTNIIAPKYCISEFHLLEKSTTWVKLGVRNWGPCKYIFHKPYSFINPRLLDCNVFLLVYGYGSERAYLYNLSTYKWHTFPTFDRPLYLKMMYMLSWSTLA